MSSKAQWLRQAYLAEPAYGLSRAYLLSDTM